VCVSECVRAQAPTSTHGTNGGFSPPHTSLCLSPSFSLSLSLSLSRIPHNLTGADVNARDKWGRTPLVWTVLNGHADAGQSTCHLREVNFVILRKSTVCAARRLLEAGADLAPPHMPNRIQRRCQPKPRNPNPETRKPNLVLTVLCVLYSLDSGITHARFALPQAHLARPASGFWP